MDDDELVGRDNLSEVQIHRLTVLTAGVITEDESSCIHFFGECHGLKAGVKDDFDMTRAMSFINIDDSCSNVGERLCPVAGYSQEALLAEVSGF